MKTKEFLSSTPGGVDASASPAPAPDFIARFTWRDHELVFSELDVLEGARRLLERCSPKTPTHLFARVA